MSRPPVPKPTLGPSSLTHGQRARIQAQAGAGTTHAETQFHARLVEQRSPLVVRLRDGEELQGVLEWYDRASLRLNMTGGGHRVIQKSAISTICKVS